MADSDSIFGNLPPQYKRMASRFGGDLYQGATHPFTALGNAIFGGLAAAPEAVGNAVSYGAGKVGLPNPELLERDVQARLEMPSFSPTGAAHVAETAPFALAAAAPMAAKRVAKALPEVAWDATANEGRGDWVAKAGGNPKIVGAPLNPPQGVTYDPLFDVNDPKLRETPNVPQFDLPRKIPAKGPTDRVTDLVNNPDVRAQMKKYISQGMDVGVPWYNTDPARQMAIDALGDEDAGNAAYRRFWDFQGATTNRNPMPSNLRTASYYYWRDKAGLPAPEVGDPTPQPYGGFGQQAHQTNVAEVMSEGGWDPLTHPKPPSFTENLVGNQMPGTMDMHATKLPAMLSRDPRWLATSITNGKQGADKVTFYPQKMFANGELTMDQAVQDPKWWEGMPRANEYKALEDYYKGLGDELGMTTAQTQASAWVGGAPVTGVKTDEAKTALGLLMDRFNNTAYRTGMTPQEAGTGFWQGKWPLLGVAAPAAVGGAAYQQQQQQPDVPGTSMNSTPFW